MKHLSRFIAFAVLSLALRSSELHAQSIGVFTTNTDVGSPSHAGSVQFDAARKTYTVTGGGANMWATNDAFQFVWKKVSGDVSLAADIKILGTEGDAHRKACLMIRQSLDKDSAYADAAFHGNGLTELQYRDAKGAVTKNAARGDAGQLTLETTTPAHLQIRKTGDTFTMTASQGGKDAQAPAAVQLHLESPFYVGLGVCSHDDKNTRQAEFTSVELSYQAHDGGTELIRDLDRRPVPTPKPPQ